MIAGLGLLGLLLLCSRAVEWPGQHATEGAAPTRTDAPTPHEPAPPGVAAGAPSDADPPTLADAPDGSSDVPARRPGGEPGGGALDEDGRVLRLSPAVRTLNRELVRAIFGDRCQGQGYPCAVEYQACRLELMGGYQLEIAACSSTRAELPAGLLPPGLPGLPP